MPKTSMISASKSDTIQTIARRARVSIATVSRVMNHPALVAEPTRRQVLQVVHERNFSFVRRRRPAPRRASSYGMVTGGSRKRGVRRIGFLAPLLTTPTGPARNVEAITEELCQGIQQVLAPREIELVLNHYPLDAPPTTCPTLGRRVLLPRSLRDSDVDGLLVRPPANRATLIEFCRDRKAVVLGNTFAGVNIPSVLVDDLAGMQLIMDYLFELGHRRIAFAGGPLQSLLHLRRFQSYQTSLLGKGMVPDQRLMKIIDVPILTNEEVEKIFREALDQWLKLPEPPTAVVASADGYALGLLRAARGRGLRVPEDLSITGFGNMEYAAVTEPPLTTIHMDQRATGAVAAALLLNLLDGLPCPSQALIQPHLVERRSCARIGK
ncbi:MAG: LacI family DNA-binding transcriptional regulator [Verrucomicrobia bacterium]|nr:LacI family DNA-binding transcriptional regulator [Verrucomicrobiota bacterium]